MSKYSATPTVALFFCGGGGGGGIPTIRARVFGSILGLPVLRKCPNHLNPKP